MLKKKLFDFLARTAPQLQQSRITKNNNCRKSTVLEFQTGIPTSYATNDIS